MNIEEPTKEQVKNFWENLGDEFECHYSLHNDLVIYHRKGNDNLEFIGYDAIDLNNLFKYARPIIIGTKGIGTWMDILNKWVSRMYVLPNITPANLLFELLYNESVNDKK